MTTFPLCWPKSGPGPPRDPSLVSQQRRPRNFAFVDRFFQRSSTDYLRHAGEIRSRETVFNWVRDNTLFFHSFPEQPPTARRTGKFSKQCSSLFCLCTLGVAVVTSQSRYKVSRKEVATLKARVKRVDKRNMATVWLIGTKHNG